MKLILTIDNPGEARNGYVNIDPFPVEGREQGSIVGDVSTLDHVVDHGEATEIIALDILDYFPGNAADLILRNWLAKLAHGGTLTVSVMDVKEVARAVLSNSISLDDVNELLHGKQEKQWQLRKSSFTLARLVEVFSGLGYKVLSKRIQNYRAVVTVRRT